jgi:hypothetical protein
MTWKTRTYCSVCAGGKYSKELGDWLISIGYVHAPELVLAVTADRHLVALGHSNPDVNANGRDRQELFQKKLGGGRTESAHFTDSRSHACIAASAASLKLKLQYIS